MIDDDEKPVDDVGDEVDEFFSDAAAVREELRLKLKTQGARVAYETMVAVARDPKAQASARATCAVALFRGAGFLGRRADEEDASEGKSIAEMTLPEMERELARLQARRKKGRPSAKTRIDRGDDDASGGVFR